MILGIDSWPNSWQIAFMIAPFILSLSGMSISFTIACSRHYEVVLKLVAKNPYLDYVNYAGGANSLSARWLVVCMGCGAVTLCRSYIRHGVVNPEMLKAFPVRLGKLMRFSTILTCIGAIWLVIVAAVLKLSEM